MGKLLIKKQDKLNLLAIILFLAANSHIFTQNNNDLFSSVFGITNDSVQVITVPLFINDFYSGDIEIHINSKDDNIQISALKLISLLENHVQKEIINGIELKINSENDTINPSALDELGMTTFYNHRELSLFIEIPLELKEEQAIDLKRNRNSALGIEIKPSHFSAYMNLYSSMNLNISGNPETREITLPINIGLDSAINIYGLVLEGDIQFNYKDVLSVSNWNARIIKDLQDQSLRLKGGTINYPVTRLQGYVPLNGISLSRNFSLNPYKNIQSLGTHPITLNYPSEVDIYINGRLLKKLNLPSGRYNLENMQLDSGTNNIEIKIKDMTGNERSLFFSQPFNINILKKRIWDFSTTLGIYESMMDTPYFSGYFRYGLTDNFTIGANIQTDFLMFNGGLSFILGTSIGHFSLDSSLSYDNGFDWATSFFYRYMNSRFKYKNNWSFTASYRGVNYSGLRLENVINSYPLRLSLYYGQILPGNINAGLTINRSFHSSWIGGNTEFVLYLSRHFGKGLLMNLSVSDRIDDYGENEFSAGLSLTINLSERNETLTTSSSWPGTSIESTWQKSSKTRLRGYNINAGISGLPVYSENTPYGFTLGGEYRGYKFTSALNHSSSFLNTNNVSLHNSSLNFSSALVYADSTLAVTRPVYDSFVIIKPKKSFRKYTIGINPEGNSFGALLNGWGNAVLPEFHSYRNGQILLEALDLPIGYDLGDSAYTFTPGYKSGAVIIVGSEAVIFAGGTLITEKGDVQPLSAVVIRSLNDDSFEEKMFFTNREGYFEVYGLSEGKWVIELVENRNYYAELTIPEGITGYFNLWNIHLIKREKR